MSGTDCPSHDAQRYITEDSRAMIKTDLALKAYGIGQVIMVFPRSEIDVRPTKFFSCISEGIPNQVDKTLI